MPQIPSWLRELRGSLIPQRPSVHRTALHSSMQTVAHGLCQEQLEPRLLLTALDDYVGAFDPNYDFEVVRTEDGDGYTIITVDMISQQWRSPEEVDRTLWQHWVQIVVPDTAVDDTALLVVNGGGNGGNPPPPVGTPGDGDTQLLIQFALTANAVVVDLPTVPNQSLSFSDEFTLEFQDGEFVEVPVQRSEDAIIAYTFDKFIDEYPNLDDNTWPLLLPMVKSAVRAMDTAQTVLSSELDYEINDFVVTGGSKRGWTTWLTAAVDERVLAIMPAVADLLNFGEQLEHHRDAYQGVTEFTVGGFSLAIGDYVAFDLPDRFQTEAGQALLEIVDPYQYRDRITQPKYLIHSPGDEFFVLDSSQFYYDDLLGDNYIRYVPNSSHGLNDSALEGSAQFFRAIVQELAIPELTWSFEDNGNTIVAETSDNPVSVKLWEAHNTESRDFRFGGGIGTPWFSTELVDQGGGTYIAKMPTPETGASAFFIEMTFASGSTTPFIFTTEVSVVGRTEGSVNAAPLAEEDFAEAFSGAPRAINVVGNDEDPDGSINPGTISFIKTPDSGTAILDPETNQVVYQSNPGFVGTDTFSYRVRDNDGALSNVASVTVDVATSNILPVAMDDFGDTFSNTAILIDVLNNDSDPDGVIDPTSVSIQSGPSNGIATVDPVTGEITYTPNEDFESTDFFTYLVQDTQSGESNLATVTVNVFEAGAGEDSVGVYNPGTGTFFLRTTNNSGDADMPAFNFGPGTSNLIPIAGDWDGDGVTTIGLYDPNTALFSLRNANDEGPADVPAFSLGGPGWLPIVGDWDGDGSDSVGVYNPAIATFQLVNELGPNPGVVNQFQYGIPGWVPIAGDWDGNGLDSVGLYNADTATFFLRNSNSTGEAQVTPFNYGISGWVPVAGDFDGDGDDTVGVVNVETATFFLRNQNTSGTASVPGFNYGLPGWFPIVGHWKLPSIEFLELEVGGDDNLAPAGLEQAVGFSLAAGLDPLAATRSTTTLDVPVHENLHVSFVPAESSLAPTDVTLGEESEFEILGAELEAKIAQALGGSSSSNSQLDEALEEAFEDLGL